MNFFPQILRREKPSAIQKVDLADSDFGRSLIIVIFTLYAFFFARNNDIVGGWLLVVLASISFLNPSWAPFRSGFILGAAAFALIFGYAFLTTILDLWGLGNMELALASAWKFLLCIPIVSTFATGSLVKSKLFPPIVFASCISLAVLLILQNNGFDLKRILSIHKIPVIDFPWNQKFHSFWLLFLFWLAASQVRKNGLRSKIMTGMLFIYCFAGVMSSYSESVKLAFVAALILFFISIKRPKLAFQACIFSLVAMVLLFPIFWQLFPFSKWTWLAERHWDRIVLFEISSNAISQKWFLGYGFGSTLSLQIAEFIPHTSSYGGNFDELANENNGMFRGSHPHNLIALIWLDFGMIGIFVLTCSILKFYRLVLPIMNGSLISSCIIGLLASAIVIFFFSFSIWQTDVILTYAMFFACLVYLVSLGLRQLGEKGQQLEN